MLDIVSPLNIQGLGYVVVSDYLHRSPGSDTYNLLLCDVRLCCSRRHKLTLLLSALLTAETAAADVSRTQKRIIVKHTDRQK